MEYSQRLGCGESGALGVGASGETVLMINLLSTTRGDIWRAAYDLSKKHQRTEIQPESLINNAGIVAMNLRDEWIFERAAEIKRRWSRLLIPHADRILERVAGVDQSYYSQLVSGDWMDDEDIQEMLAHAVAVLVWYHFLNSGRVDHLLYFTEKEAVTFLGNRQTPDPPKIKPAKPTPKAKPAPQPAQALQLSLW